MTLLVLAALAASAAMCAAYASRPRTASSPTAHRELVVRHAAFPLPVARPGDTDYDALYAIPSRKSIGEAAGRRKPFRPPSVVTLGATATPGAHRFRSPDATALAQAAASAGCPLSIEPSTLRLERLETTDLFLRLGAGHAPQVGSAGRFSLTRLIEITDTYSQVKGLEIVLGESSPPQMAIHDADSLLDFCESIAGATGLPVGIRASADDVPFWMDLARLIDTTNRRVDFITIPAETSDILAFAVGFSRVQKLFAMRALHGRTTFVGARAAWSTADALFAFALGCDLLEVNGSRSRRQSGIAAELIATRRQILAECRRSGALHPADVLASQVEMIDPPCWSRTVAEMFGGRGVGSACGDERRFIDSVERGANALPFRRRH